MWCSKCHYGSDGVVWKLDEDGKFHCRQCGTQAEVLTRNPFFGNKNGRTLGGRKTEQKPKFSKKFQFDQKGGSDSLSPAIIKEETKGDNPK